MSLLPDLERQLMDAATGAVTPSPAPTPRRRRRWLRAAGLLVFVPAAGGVALAATGLWPSGEPVKPKETFKYTEGLGVPIASTIKLGDVVAQDPVGGPPWGLRFVRTSRGYGCVQVGRLVNGKLGMLGANGAFGNDGAFHELRADDLTRGTCRPIDANGRTFIAVSQPAVSSSASDDGCTASRIELPPADRLARLSASMRKSVETEVKRPDRRACPRDARRALYYGVLGPQVRTLDHRAPDGTEARSKAGPGGAYLFVDRAPAWVGGGGTYSSDGQVSESSVNVNPLLVSYSGITSIAYADGTACPVVPGGRTCLPRGYEPTHPRLPSADRVATRVTASVVKSFRPHGALRLRFRAPVATRGSKMQYALMFRLPCDSGTPTAVSVIARNIDRGEAVTADIPIPWPKCLGRFTGTLYLADTPDLGGSPGSPGTPPFWTELYTGPRGKVLVGRFDTKAAAR